MKTTNTSRVSTEEQKEADVWYYNDNLKYSFKSWQSVNGSKEWKPFEDLF